MSHRQCRYHSGRDAPAKAPRPEPRPIERLHPSLYYLMARMKVLPPGDLASLSEAELTGLVAQAIMLAPDDEQAYVVSRFMTDDEIAQQRLRSPQVQDLQRHTAISAQERRLLLRASPEPDDDDNDDASSNGAPPCLVCAGRSAVAAPCGCRYCLPCLRTCIRAGLGSELDFPPRCCRPLGETTIRRAGRPGLVHLFRQLTAEYAVPAAQRVYCHDVGCGAFVPPPPGKRQKAPSDAAAVGACPVCSKETCMACGGRAHRGLPCSEEADEEEMWKTMDELGLAQCPICGVVVALKDGCNHITCVCKAEFCYLCSLKWRKCRCPLYGGLHLRVPVRKRPGKKPITRGGRAHLASQASENTMKLPQLRPEEDEDLVLAASFGVLEVYDRPAGTLRRLQRAPVTAKNLRVLQRAGSNPAAQHPEQRVLSTQNLRRFWDAMAAQQTAQGAFTPAENLRLLQRQAAMEQQEVRGQIRRRPEPSARGTYGRVETHNHSMSEHSGRRR